MVAADILISDYSSIVFDYSILEKPIFLYTYDLSMYQKERGLYLDVEKDIPIKVCKNEIELLNSICEIDLFKEKEKTKKFKNKFIEFGGNASRETAEIVKNKK